MKRTVLAALIVSVCLFGAGLIGIVVFGAWAPVSRAQVIDSNDCERACYEQESACVRVCGEHTNPDECDATCQDHLEDCLRECR